MSSIAARFTLGIATLVLGAAATISSDIAVGASRTTAPAFGIFVASRDGSGLGLVLGSTSREMTHARVSPDLRRIVFTRYNLRGADGKATEQQGYEETEIVLVNIDGSGQKVLVPAQAGIVAANASWSPDGQSIYFLSTDNAYRVPEVHVIDLATKVITRVATPEGMLVSDPDRVANRLVFPQKVIDGTADRLWTMDIDGRNARQLTSPVATGADGFRGDFDPKLSPDGNRVAFMRIDGGVDWKVRVVDVATGEETLLTPDGVIQCLPAWSSDGARLVYVQFNLEILSDSGIFTMNADGTDRVKVPLPAGRVYNHASWFPLEGSSASARLVFSGALNSAF